MKIQVDRRHLKIGIVSVMVLCLAILFYFAVKRIDGLVVFINSIKSIFAPFIYGLVMAYLLSPVYNRSKEKLLKVNWPKYRGRDISPQIANILAITVSLIVMFGVIAALIWAVLPSLIDSIISVGRSLPSTSEALIEWVQDKFQRMPEFAGPLANWVDKISGKLIEWVNATLEPSYKAIIEGVSDSIYSVLIMIKNFLIGVIICSLFLSNKDTFKAQSKKGIFAFMDMENADNFLRGAEFVNKTFGAFINGKIIDSAIIGIICFIFMSIFNWPYAILISVIVGVTNIIPFFGPFIGAIPSALLILTVEPNLCPYFLLFILCLQQLDGNIIGPKILGEVTGLPTFWVMFAIIIGGGLFGFIGMILGVPVFAVIYAYVTYKVNTKLETKNMATDLEVYKKLYVNLNDGKKSPWAKPAKEKKDKC